MAGSLIVDVAGIPEPEHLLIRCPWAGTDPLMRAYHDTEWGVPCHDERELFERLILECFQAGLSWATILRKRPAFTAAFADWSVETVAAFGRDDIERLMGDAGIVRNRAKIVAAIGNANGIIALQQEFGSFDAFLWGRTWDTSGLPEPVRPATMAGVPAQTPASIALSKDLRTRGFNFVGPTICYAFMQSIGMVDDHLPDCWRASPA